MEILGSKQQHDHLGAVHVSARGGIHSVVVKRPMVVDAIAFQHLGGSLSCEPRWTGGNFGDGACGMRTAVYLTRPTAPGVPAMKVRLMPDYAADSRLSIINDETSYKVAGVDLLKDPWLRLACTPIQLQAGDQLTFQYEDNYHRDNTGVAAYAVSLSGRTFSPVLALMQVISLILAAWLLRRRWWTQQGAVLRAPTAAMQSAATQPPQLGPEVNDNAEAASKVLRTPESNPTAPVGGAATIESPARITTLRLRHAAPTSVRK